MTEISRLREYAKMKLIGDITSPKKENPHDVPVTSPKKENPHKNIQKEIIENLKLKELAKNTAATEDYSPRFLGSQRLSIDARNAVLKLAEEKPYLAECFDKYQEYNKGILDIAEQTGLINPEQRGLWETEDYITFARDLDATLDMENIAINQSGISGKKNLAGQTYKIHELTG